MSAHPVLGAGIRGTENLRRERPPTSARKEKLCLTIGALSFAFVTQTWLVVPSHSQEVRDHRTGIRDHREFRRIRPNPDALACLPRSAVTCSTDWLQVAPPVAAYSQIFQDACVLHDYCYRFGKATYGYSQKKCDDFFLDDALDTCSDTTVWDVATLGTTKVACAGAAHAFYGAARAFGKGPFQEQGTLCDYEAVTGKRPIPGPGDKRENLDMRSPGQTRKER